MPPTDLATSRGLVAIRPAGEADLTAYRRLRLEALRNHPTAFSSDLEQSERRPDSFWAERLRNLGSTAMLFFAEHGGELVGMTGIVLGDSAKTRHSGLIVSVYVQPEWRGLHLTGALIEAGVEWARARGVTILKLGVTVSNTPAIQAYVRSGFSVYGLDPQAIRVDGVDYDELLMSRAV